MGKRPGLVRYLRNLLKIIFIELDPWKRIEENLILRLLGMLRNQAICDVACGIGRIDDELCKLGGRVSGMDINEDEVRVGRETSASIDFIVGAAEHLPYRSSSFDKAVSVCALEHFTDDGQALKEMNRILKKGGNLVLTADSFSHPNLNQKIIDSQRRMYDVERYYTKETLARSLKRAGFTVKSLDYHIKSPFSAAMFKLRFKLGRRAKYFPFIPLILFLSYPLCQRSDKGYADQFGYFLSALSQKSR